MAQDDRNSSERGGRPMRTGPDRDPFRSGDERRYMPDRGDRERGFRGDRSYATGGYSEEQGYRREDRGDWDRDASNQRDEDHWRTSQQGRDEQRDRDQWSQQNRSYGPERQGSGRDRSRGQSSQYGRQGEEDYRRGQFRGQQTRGYGDTSSADLARGWSNLDSPAYFGTGNYGGSYGSGPGSRASEEGLFGPSANAAGHNSWNESDSNWLPESSAARGTDTDYLRGTSGDYSNYGRSQYGAQSSYGRDYGDDDSNRSGASQEWRESHRGRGPKGYARSDDRLREVICERLTDDPRIDASEIHVEVKEQTVKLTGSVRDRRTKYEVEDLVEHCGAKDIDNQLRVQSRWGSQSSDSNRDNFRNTVQSNSDDQQRSGSRYDYSGSSTDAQSGSSQLASAAARSNQSSSTATSTSSDGPTPSGTGASASAPGTSPGVSKRDNRST
jgi:BON domain